MGPACEAAIEKIGLPDTVHTALRELVLTRVNTSWLRHLKDKPLFLSDDKAQTIYTAIMEDSQSD